MEARAVRGAGGRSGPECYQCFKTPCGGSRRASATNTTSSAAAPSAASTSTTDIAKVTTPEVEKEQGAVAGSGPINPCANHVVTEGNTLLSDKEMEMVVMLRMNESFITFMRKEYPHVAKEQFADFGTVLTKKENIEDDIMEALSY